MAKILGNFHLALLIGIVLLVAAMVGLHHGDMDKRLLDRVPALSPVFAGILWIGLLYYFNFVQIPTMPKVPAELKPGVTKYIAPAALFWFRWAAVATVVLGLLLVELRQRGDAARALGLQEPATRIDRHRHVARHDHGGERLVRDLAEPEEGARHRHRRRRQQGEGRRAWR